MLGESTKAAAVLAGLLTCFISCGDLHRHPANVPSSAVWVDGAFIDCSVEEQSRANRCTVYRENTGEILADGLFVLNTSLREAGTSDLHYVAFGKRVIYLADARKLVPWIPSERDPIKRLLNEKLRALAGGRAGEAIDCQNIAGPDGRLECVVRAFADHKPFFARYYVTGFFSPGFQGVAGDANGNAYVVDSSWTGNFFEREPERFADNQIVVIPCPQPVTFRMVGEQLTCAVPVGHRME
jgi:hypothetical protein